jgi:hypothetical protein
MFTYADGQSTADFTDMSFPANIVTRGDFTEEERVAAMAACEFYGVAAGPSFDDCELDMLAAGDWGFAAAAAQVKVPSIVAGDVEVDGSGYLGVDYEGDIPNNFSGIRVGTSDELTTLAGPFSNSEQYRFYVPQLPGHDQVELGFDLIAFGTWGASDSIKLEVDDVSVAVDVDWSQAETGELANGMTYRKVRVTVPVLHHMSQYAATISGHGLSSTSGEGFGIDNVSVSLNLVPAQAFALPLTQGIPTEINYKTSTDGSGVLESRGAIDSYALDVPADSGIYLDWQVGAYALGWRVLDSDGDVLDSGRASVGDATISVPSAGATLETYALGANPPIVQNYVLAVYWVSAPDVFDVGVLSQTPVSASGNFETKASVDEFVFTVAEDDSRVVVELGGVFYGGDQYGAWRLVDADGVEIAADGRRHGVARVDQVLAAGQYQLIYRPEYDKTGGYSVRMYLPPDAQQFDLTLSSTTPLAISDGVPVAGAGNLETWLSRDVYAFDVAQGDALAIDQTWGYGAHKAARWELTDPSGVVVAEGAMSGDAQVTDLDAGTYQWEVFFPETSTTNSGTYNTSLMIVPSPDVFDVGVLSQTPVSISNGVPGVGAGNFESKYSVDEYVFTVPEGGSRVVVGLGGVIYSGSRFALWELVDGDGVAVASGARRNGVAQFDQELPAGQYRLIYRPESDKTGIYWLSIGVQ